MKNLSSKFLNFLENLKMNENSEIIETIKTGFNLIEALSTDDANPKKLGQPVYLSGAPKSEITIQVNKGNEYFNQTLPDEILKKINQSQAGKRIWNYPKAGKWVVSHDPLTSGQGYQNANTGSTSVWGGDSGGYNLGGP